MRWAVGDVLLLWWTDGSRLLVLLAQGWTIEAFDDRYGSVLMSREEAP